MPHKVTHFTFNLYIIFLLCLCGDQHFSKRCFWKRPVTHHNRQHQYAMLGDETIRCHGEQFILKHIVWNKLLMFSIRQWTYCFCIVKMCCGYTRLNLTRCKFVSCNTSIYYYRSYLFIGLTLECYSVQKHEPQTDSHRYIMLIVGLPFPSSRHWNMGIRCCFVSQIPGGKPNLESWRSMLNITTNQK